tara:strand:+ start:991 stop:1392 length:402 start_codon:yes stop_codon:yes gene_type:complete
MAELINKIRADKWLWYARFFKTRTLASQLCKSGKLRINGERVSKASVTVQVGDVLTFSKVNDIKVVQLLALGERRGPATEAQTLYDDQSPAMPTKAEAQEKSIKEGASVIRETGAGRPTKAERRATDKLMGRD